MDSKVAVQFSETFKDQCDFNSKPQKLCLKVKGTLWSFGNPESSSQLTILYINLIVKTGICAQYQKKESKALLPTMSTQC